MNIILNTSTPGIEKYRKPDFTANLKGSAIRSAVTKAKDIAEVAEIREIIDNVRYLGDATTEILCENNGSVTISNPKFGKLAHTFKMKLNEKSENPFIEMLARFNTANFLIKCEGDLIEKRFVMAKPSSKQALYNMYKSSNLATTTGCALDYVARSHGLLPESPNTKFTLQDFKNMMFPEYFKK